MARPPHRLTPIGFHPRVTLHADGSLGVERRTLSAPADPFASGLELAAIAIDEHGGLAPAPLARRARLVARIARRLGENPSLRTRSAAATVLLELAIQSRPLRREALAAYLALLERTRSVELRDSMTFNLDRARPHLDAAARDALAAAWERVLPASPPYAAWFSGKRDLRVLCQVQEVFFVGWQRAFRRLGFRPEGRRLVRDDGDTRIVVDYRQKGEGIFTAMADPQTDVVMFLGHSDWWARVPRNLASAPDQVGDKLLVLIMCFGKHFYHSLHARYPRAHVVTTKDPTEDPEDEALLRHLFDGISARRSWAAIRRAARADRVTEDNFIFPIDARYVAGVIDTDRDGRLDRLDRFCNLGARRVLAPAAGEEGFVPDPPGLHPRGAELSPRELDGGPVLEAALMLNSLSYDNYWLDQVNQDQRVVAAGWHNVAPADFAAARFAPARLDGRDVVRMTCSTRYAHAAQPVLTAMVVYEGWRWWAGRLPRRDAPSALETTVMGILLVAHALANADYPCPEAVFHAWLRRWGFPAHVPYDEAVKAVEADPDWESGSPRAVARYLATLPASARDRLA